MANKSGLISPLLIEEMSSAIDGCQETSEFINSECASRALLPKDKEVIRDCYILKWALIRLSDRKLIAACESFVGFQ